MKIKNIKKTIFIICGMIVLFASFLTNVNLIINRSDARYLNHDFYQSVETKDKKSDLNGGIRTIKKNIAEFVTIDWSGINNTDNSRKFKLTDFFEGCESKKNYKVEAAEIYVDIQWQEQEVVTSHDSKNNYQFSLEEREALDKTFKEGKELKLIAHTGHFFSYCLRKLELEIPSFKMNQKMVYVNSSFIEGREGKFRIWTSISKATVWLKLSLLF